MLGFRSLFRTHDVPDLVEIALVEFHGWLRDKRYDPELLTGEHATPIADGVLGSVQRRDDDVGSSAARARVVEHSPQGVWTSELTVFNSPTGNRGWIWLDIHKPDDHGWTATPRLARRLVRRLPVRDGGHALVEGPRLVREPAVDRLVAALTDPNRRGLAFVAGSGATTGLHEWRDRVTALLRDTAGLANGWVLDPAATDRFGYLMGSTHDIAAGRLRTYLPGVQPGNTMDAQRHRFLTRATLDRAPVNQVRRLLGQRARDQMISGRLPDTLRDLDRILRRQVDDDLIDELSATASVAEVRTAPTAPGTIRPRPSRELPPPIAEPAPATDADPRTETPATTPERDDGLARLLETVLGTTETSPANLQRLRELAVVGMRTEAVRERIGARLTQLQDQLDEADLAREIATEELEVERRERADAEGERAEAERQLRWVRARLTAAGDAGAAWADPELDVRDLRPETFVDLLAQIDVLTGIVFTGDREITLALDKHPARSWAGKAWDALLALDDYARISHDGGFAGDVTAYLVDTPATCHGFSANRHAPTESEEVQNMPRLRTPRELPVPDIVDPAGRVFMGAHFKIAQSARVSPRLHYLDETARSGVVYVGYLGPHLPLAHT